MNVLRIVFLILLVLHGLIHALGFISAFKLATISQFTQSISKAIGLWWLTVSILFIITAVLFIINHTLWVYLGVIAVIISQTLIIFNWHDARAGTVVNVIIFIVLLFTFTTQLFERKFQNDASEMRTPSAPGQQALLTEDDLKFLPPSVQRYLHYSNVLNKPKVKSIKVIFEGEMRAKGEDYFHFTSEQYNFFDEPTRLFFMKAHMFGITVPGYHKYKSAQATMDIRLFGLFSVVNKSGAVLDKTETVTLFNDMCLLAPASLIDSRIQWKEITDTTCMATFTNHNITISATLQFNRQGQLLNFVSNDRTDVNEMQQIPFSTPVHEYIKLEGRQVIHRGDAVWHYPEGDFTYGKFTLKDIQFNLR